MLLLIIQVQENLTQNITDTKLYAAIATLSTEDNTKVLQ